MIKSIPKAGTDQKKLEQRWTVPLIRAGYTVIPNAILYRQKALGIDSVDLNIILQIASHWWSPESLPFPSKKRLAAAVNISESAVRKRLAALEKGGLLTRISRPAKHGGNDTNLYDLGPLIKEATPYAQDMLQEIKVKTAAKIAKLSKKGKPQLKVV